MYSGQDTFCGGIVYLRETVEFIVTTTLPFTISVSPGRKKAEINTTSIFSNEPAFGIRGEVSATGKIIDSWKAMLYAVESFPAVLNGLSPISKKRPELFEPLWTTKRERLIIFSYSATGASGIFCISGEFRSFTFPRISISASAVADMIGWFKGSILTTLLLVCAICCSSLTVSSRAFAASTSRITVWIDSISIPSTMTYIAMRPILCRLGSSLGHLNQYQSGISSSSNPAITIHPPISNTNQCHKNWNKFIHMMMEQFYRPLLPKAKLSESIAAHWARLDTRTIFLPRLPQGGEGRGEEPMFTSTNPSPQPSPRLAGRGSYFVRCGYQMVPTLQLQLHPPAF